MTNSADVYTDGNVVVIQFVVEKHRDFDEFLYSLLSFLSEEGVADNDVNIAIPNEKWH